MSIILSTSLSPALCANFIFSPSLVLQQLTNGFLLGDGEVVVGPGIVDGYGGALDLHVYINHVSHCY